mgnify:CR=1 FL=1
MEYISGTNLQLTHNKINGGNNVNMWTIVNSGINVYKEKSNLYCTCRPVKCDIILTWKVVVIELPPFIILSYLQFVRWERDIFVQNSERLNNTQAKAYIISLEHGNMEGE